jgi:CoA:oxalate CoA-transferase
MTGALNGVRVLEIASYTAGPLCAEFLAQLGAEVVKVEPPHGEEIRRVSYRVGDDPYIFHINNAGKRCVTADLKRAPSRDLVLELAANADVYLENLAPGAMARFGLDYDAVRSVAPEIIYCSLNGFGARGPLSGKKAYDSMIQGLAGLVSLTGPRERPVKAGPSIADLSSAVAGATAIAAALYEKQRSGKGQQVEVAMFDVVAWLTQEAWPEFLSGEEPPQRDGNRWFARGPQNTYEASDGLVAIAVETDAQWHALCSLIGRDDLSADGRFQTGRDRVRFADELDAVIGGWIAQRTRPDAVERCQAAGVPAAPVLTLDEVVEQPQLDARDMFVELHDPTGEHRLRLPGPAQKLSKTPGRIERAGEPVGASNAAVYGGLLGHSSAELARLREEGMI